MQPFTISHSQISKSRCGRLFELSYIEGLQRKEGTHSRNRLFGSAFHEGMAEVLRYSTDYRFDVKEAIRRGRDAIRNWLNENAEVDRTDYEGNIDVEYYAMIDTLKHEVGVLLEWFVPVSEIGSRYRVATMYDIFGTANECDQCDEGETEDDCTACNGGYLVEGEGCDECVGTGYIYDDCINCVLGHVPDMTPFIEWSFDYPLNDTVNLRGFVDAILYDTIDDMYIIVDWKTRAKSSDDILALLDQQLHLYAAIIHKMRDDLQHVEGKIIEAVRMWEVRTKPPAPAKITKSGKPSIAASGIPATTRETWLASLDEKTMAKYGNDEAFISSVKSIKPLSYFSNMVDEYLSDAMETLTLDNIVAQAEQIKHYHDLHQQGKTLPAMLSSYACKGCDFIQLCGTALRHGTDPTTLIEADFEYKEGYDPSLQ